MAQNELAEYCLRLWYFAFLNKKIRQQTEKNPPAALRKKSGKKCRVMCARRTVQRVSNLVTARSHGLGPVWHKRNVDRHKVGVLFLSSEMFGHSVRCFLGRTVDYCKGQCRRSCWGATGAIFDEFHLVTCGLQTGTRNGSQQKYAPKKWLLVSLHRIYLSHSHCNKHLTRSRNWYK